MAAKEGTPPPVIGKMGRYTVFMTPPSTPTRAEKLELAKVVLPSPSPPPPVRPPPQRLEKPAARSSPSVMRFFRDAVSRVQEVHSSLDDYLADWFGLNHSKYQWALNDYYESKRLEKEAGKVKELAKKVQGVFHFEEAAKLYYSNFEVAALEWLDFIVAHTFRIRGGEAAKQRLIMESLLG